MSSKDFLVTVRFRACTHPRSYHLEWQARLEYGEKMNDPALDRLISTVDAALNDKELGAGTLWSVIRMRVEEAKRWTKMDNTTTENEVTTKFFTFGTNHTNLQGLSRGNSYISITAPRWADHRAILMQYIGGNQFSHEYDDDEDFRNMVLTYRLKMEAQIRVFISEYPC